MKSKFIFILLFVTNIYFSFSQTVIKGRVIDKTSMEPVPGAIISVPNSIYFVTTDDDGYFNLSHDHAKCIYLKHMAYMNDTIEVNNPDSYLEIILTPQNYELSEIKVVPLDLKKIIEISIKKLQTSLEKKISRKYHLYVEEDFDSEKKREISAMLDISLQRINRRREFKWNMDILDIEQFDDQIKNCLIDCGIILEQMEIPQFGQYNIEYSNKEEEILTIKLHPKKIDLKRFSIYEYAIDMIDTTLIELNSQTADVVENLTPYKFYNLKWRRKNHFFKTIFEKDKNSNRYYLQSFISNSTLNVELPDGTQHIQNTKNTIYCSPNKSFNSIFSGKKRKIKPYTFSIFETK